MRYIPRYTTRNFYVGFVLIALLSCDARAQQQTASNTQSSTLTANHVATAPNAMEQEFVKRINDDRKSRGLCLLQIDPMLTAVARDHSKEMCDKNYFDHHSPTVGLNSPLDRYISRLASFERTPPEYALVGENIYYASMLNSVYNVSYAHQALMKSPNHRKNILEPRYEKVGIGTYRNAAGEFWVTEVFLRDEVENAPQHNPSFAQSPDQKPDTSSSVASEPEP